MPKIQLLQDHIHHRQHHDFSKSTDQNQKHAKPSKRPKKGSKDLQVQISVEQVQKRKNKKNKKQKKSKSQRGSQSSSKHIKLSKSKSKQKKERSSINKNENAFNQQLMGAKQNEDQPCDQINSSKVHDNKENKNKKKYKNKNSLFAGEISPEQAAEYSVFQRQREYYEQFLLKNNINLSIYDDLNMALKQSVLIATKHQQLNQLRNSRNRKDNNHNQKEYEQLQAKQFQPQPQFEVFNMVIELQKFSQDRIYHAMLQQNLNFNEVIWRSKISSQPVKQQVESMFQQINCLVLDSIYQGQDGYGNIRYKADQVLTKEQIMSGYTNASQIKKAENIIKNKLAGLNAQFMIPSDLIGDSSVITHQRFSLKSQQTRKAQSFVQKMQEQQKQIRQRNKKILDEQMLKEEMSKNQQQQMKKKLNQQRQSQMKLKFSHNERARQQEKERRIQKQKQFKEYLSEQQQKVPLFQKKRQDFEKFIIEEQLRKLESLDKVRQSKRSVSRDQIELHNKKYKQLKELLEQQRQEMLNLTETQIQQNRRPYFKSKFNQSILRQSAQLRTLSTQKRNKIDELYTKRSQYATIIHKNFVPKIDLQKKQQLERNIKKTSLSKKKDEQFLAQKTKMEGNRNLQKLHQFVEELKAKGKARDSKTHMALMLQQNTNIKKASDRYKNYLNEIRHQPKENYHNESSSKNPRKLSRMMRSLDVSNFQDEDDDEDESYGSQSRLTKNTIAFAKKKSLRSNIPLPAIELQARRLQKVADRKSQFLKYSDNSLDIDNYMAKKFEVEDQYLSSAKAKVKLLGIYQ